MESAVNPDFRKITVKPFTTARKGFHANGDSKLSSASNVLNERYGFVKFTNLI